VAETMTIPLKAGQHVAVQQPTIKRSNPIAIPTVASTQTTTLRGSASATQNTSRISNSNRSHCQFERGGTCENNDFDDDLDHDEDLEHDKDQEKEEEEEEEEEEDLDKQEEEKAANKNEKVGQSAQQRRSVKYMLSLDKHAPWSTTKQAKERVCSRCVLNVQNVVASEAALRMILNNEYLDVRDWPKLALVSKAVCSAITFLKDKWERMAHHACYVTASPSYVARALLLQNKHLLRGHPSWSLLLARANVCTLTTSSSSSPKSSIFEYPAQQVAPCSSVGCRVSCSVDANGLGQLSIGQCITALRKLDFNHALCRAAIGRLTHLATHGTPGLLYSFVPVLLSLARAQPSLTKNSVLENVICPAAARDEETLYLAYFCARARVTWHDLKRHLYKHAATTSQKSELQKSESFLNALQNACLSVVKEPSAAAAASAAAACLRSSLDCLDGNNPLLPGTCRYRIISVDTSTLKQLGSATRPWVVKCLMSDAQSGLTTHRILMLKQECVWNDLTVMLIQRQLYSSAAANHEKDEKDKKDEEDEEDEAEKRTTNVNHQNKDEPLLPQETLQLESYHVAPISKDAGLILFVDGCQSMANIQRDNGTILSYLTDALQTKSARVIQQTFMQSCASNCVLSLLFGFGDRHLNNILVSSNSGRLVHIDFGYLWSKEPSISTHRFSLPDQQIRITKGMLDVFRTHFYSDFLKQCARVSQHVERNATDLFNVCWVLVDLGLVKEPRVQAHFSTFILAPITADMNSTPQTSSSACSSSSGSATNRLATCSSGSKFTSFKCNGSKCASSKCSSSHNSDSTPQAAKVVDIIHHETTTSSSSTSSSSQRIASLFDGFISYFNT
jgi:hypothetical protein